MRCIWAEQISPLSLHYFYYSEKKLLQSYKLFSDQLKKGLLVKNNRNNPVHLLILSFKDLLAYCVSA